MDNNKQQLTFISFAYAIGIILVVFGHSYPLGNSYVPQFMLYIRSFIYSFHMPLFFFISGVLMKYTHRGKSLCMGEYLYFIRKKAMRLLTPYFVLTLLAFVPKILVAQYVTNKVLVTFNYFIKVFLVPRESIWGHFWFIPVLFILFCCSYLMLKSLRRTWHVVLFTGIFVLLNTFPIDIGWFGIKDVCVYGFYFFIGILSSDVVIKNQDKLFSLNKGICTVVISVGLFICSHLVMKQGIIINSLFVIITALVMIYSIFALGALYQRKKYRFLEWMQEKNFTIYLLSWPCSALVQIYLNKFLELNWSLVMPAMFLAGLLGPLIVISFYEKLKINNKFLKIIVGIK